VLADRLGSNTAPDFPADEYKEFDVDTRETVAHRAYALLVAHVRFRAAKTETNFWSLYHAMIALLRHDEQTLCYSLFLIDEAGRRSILRRTQAAQPCFESFCSLSRSWSAKTRRKFQEDTLLCFVDLLP